MSEIFNQIIPQNTNEKKSEIELAQSLKLLVQELIKITEFSRQDLNYSSMIEGIRYLKPFIDYRNRNKKHRKRKHSKELLTAIDNIAKALSSILASSSDSNSLLANLLPQRR
ncbi:MAG: hypothetical protein ACTSQS_11530 [Promethearchaeota archaeon]